MKNQVINFLIGAAIFLILNILLSPIHSLAIVVALSIIKEMSDVVYRLEDPELLDIFSTILAPILITLGGMYGL